MEIFFKKKKWGGGVKGEEGEEGDRKYVSRDRYLHMVSIVLDLWIILS